MNKPKPDSPLRAIAISTVVWASAYVITAMVLHRTSSLNPEAALESGLAGAITLWILGRSKQSLNEIKEMQDYQSDRQIK